METASARHLTLPGALISLTVTRNSLMFFRVRWHRKLPVDSRPLAHITRPKDRSGDLMRFRQQLE